ncbi:DCC1-like thiol-disulfide oxidoreductase family protein [Dankookia sp. P2]|uniref:DCC1-like thiol-disulfide oxidoreductase family protein n=1 Tax=Dankookia sp. P2 TaxID=3423955 RepID=UPI003D67346A
MSVDTLEKTAPPSAGDAEAKQIWVVYDGMCPFCTRYVMLYRIRQLAEKVHMIDARTDHPVVREVKARGLSLENGMAVKWNGQYYHGAAALHVLALLGSESGAFNRLNRLVFSRPKLGRFLYPAMVAGRRLTLKLLGRPPIAD